MIRNQRLLSQIFGKQRANMRSFSTGLSTGFSNPGETFRTLWEQSEITVAEQATKDTNNA
jgi:phosphate starvation-inducible protein PhoH